MSRYEVVYFGGFFVGDKENKWNVYEARDWNDVYSLYFMLREDAHMKAYIKDNDEDVYYEDGEWY